MTRVRALLSPESAASPLLWFAVVGAPGAWVAQFGINYWLSEAQCSPTGGEWGIPLETWGIVVGIVCALVAAAAGAASVSLFLRTREHEEDDAPPAGRIHFLSVVGMAVTSLFFVLILMTMVATIVHTPCNQS
jgi:hypothetical protein